MRWTERIRDDLEGARMSVVPNGSVKLRSDALRQTDGLIGRKIVFFNRLTMRQRWCASQNVESQEKRRRDE
jgi:hypothetical protein